MPPEVHHKLPQVTDSFDELCLPKRQKVILLSALNFGRVITNQHEKAFDQLTKLLTQYYLAHPRGKISERGTNENRTQNCGQTRDCV